MKKHKIRPRSGESLAEILVSTLIFLMMVAVLQGAVSFATNAVSSGKTADYIFSPDGNESNQLFTVRVSLQTKTVSYVDEEGQTQTSVFFVFEPEETGGADAGGETP